MMAGFVSGKHLLEICMKSFSDTALCFIKVPDCKYFYLAVIRVGPETHRLK